MGMAIDLSVITHIAYSWPTLTSCIVIIRKLLNYFIKNNLLYANYTLFMAYKARPYHAELQALS